MFDQTFKWMHWYRRKDETGISFFWLFLATLTAVVVIIGAFCVFCRFFGDHNSEIISVKPPLQGALLWTRNKTIMYSKIDQWNPLPVTQGENPRWSPDGQSIVFTRNNDVWIMDVDFNNQRLLFKGVVTEGGAGAFWTRDGKGLTAILQSDSRRVILYSFQSRNTVVIHDETQSPFHGYHLSQSAELRKGNRYLLTFTEDEGHRAFIVDLKEKKYIFNEGMASGDCNPTWAPDGTFLVVTRRAWVRPIFRADFVEDGESGRVEASRYLIGAGKSHWPSISNDSSYVVYSDHTNIHIAPVEQTVNAHGHGIQLSASRESDISPNLHIFQRN